MLITIPGKFQTAGRYIRYGSTTSASTGNNRRNSVNSFRLIYESIVDDPIDAG